MEEEEEEEADDEEDRKWRRGCHNLVGFHGGESEAGRLLAASRERERASIIGGMKTCYCPRGGKVRLKG